MPSLSKPILVHDKEYEERGQVLNDSRLPERSRRSIRVNRCVLLKHVLGYLIAIENNHLAAKEIEADEIAYDFISKFDNYIDLSISRTMSSSHVVQCLPTE